MAQLEENAEIRGKGRRLGVCLLLLVTVAQVAWVWPRHPEPCYEGKPVSFWVRHPKVVPLKDMGGQFTTFEQFPRMDSKAVPFLVRELREHDGRLQKWYATLRMRSPLWMQKHMPPPVYESDRRVRAVALLAFSPESSTATSVAIEAMLHDPDELVRLNAAVGLSAWADNRETTVKAWFEATTNSCALVRAHAHMALRSLGLEPTPPTPPTPFPPFGPVSSFGTFTR